MECDDLGEEDEPRNKEALVLLDIDSSTTNYKSEIVKVEPRISILILLGSPNPKKIRLVGIIQSCMMVIFIDTGSTYNFINPFVIKRTRHQPLPTE